MVNFQESRYEKRVIDTEYSGVGGTVVAERNSLGGIVIRDTNSEFVFGFEARAETAFHVTEHFQVRGGIDVIDFASGIWRGANPSYGNTALSDQDVQIAGFTFGLTLNR